MIRRDDNGHWLLIRQTEHARLAADIAGAWGSRQIPPLPMADLLVPVIRHHDDGWRDWTPTIDSETGRPRGFTEMPMTVATELWSRSIEICNRIAETPSPTPDADSTGPFAEGPLLLCGNWVSRHFCYLAEQVRRHHPDNSADIAAVECFLDEQARLQSEGLHSLRAAFLDDDDLNCCLETGYRLLQFFDRLSLWLALRSPPLSRRLKPYEHLTGGPRIDPGLSIVGQLLPGPVGSGDADRLALSPYPLSVPQLELSVSARRLPAEPFASDDDFRRALEQAPLVTLRWIIEPLS